MVFNGVWTNELGSTMTLVDDGAGGLTGTYVSGTGNFQGVQFPLVGRYDTAGVGGSTAVGWTVAWQVDGTDAQSVTSWSGQLVDGVIFALWLLTSEAELGELWAATNVGEDVFWQPEQSRPQLTRARAASHPV